jgi:hypothetical protein
MAMAAALTGLRFLCHLAPGIDEGRHAGGLHNLALAVCVPLAHQATVAAAGATGDTCARING